MTVLLAFITAVLTLLSSAVGAQTVSQPKSVALTVYNADYALVRDQRAITLQRGVNSIEIPDVAARIDPTSVLFRSLTDPASVDILEQNYQYDLISPENILNKSVGQRILFTRFDSQGGAHTDSGVLLNPPKNGGMVVRSDDGGTVLNPPGSITLMNMPEGLHPRPTLNWLLSSGNAGEHSAEISYITDGIGWKADYVALVDQNDTSLDLAGWVTLDNRSGATYADASLTLMAGDVRRSRPTAVKRADALMYSVGAVAGAPQFEEKSFFEYHMYTMARPTTIRDNETKQLSLLTASGASIRKEMIYDGRGNWWRNWWYPGRSGDPGGGYDTSDYHKVNVVLEVKNSKDNQMGMPLPAGRIRVYKLDDTGSQQFIGEDSIDHTPKDETIRLYIGDAFDVVGDYKRSDYRKIAANVQEESFEVRIRNHKDTAVEVKAVDHVWSDWKVIANSHPFEKKDAHTIEFPVTVPADGEVVITYTIRTEW